MKKLLQTLFFFLLVTQICFGQWVQVGLNDESIKDIAVYNSLIFVVTSDSGKLYRSTDNGINWATIFELGVIDIDVSPTGDVFMLKDSIYNTGPKQLFRSTDAGSSWNYLNVIDQIQGTHDIIGPNNVRISPTGTIFLGYEETSRHYYASAIAISTDNGISWMPLHSIGGLVYDFRGNSIITLGFVTVPEVGPWTSISLSDDGGLLWSTLGFTPIWYVEAVNLRLCLNGNILAGGGGMFLSDDSCNSWTQISTILPTCGLSIESGGMLVGTDSLGVFLFSDNGDSLGSFNESLTNLNTHALTMDINGYVYLGTDNGVWRRPLSEITSVEDNLTNLPLGYYLSQNYPNPFNPSTKIKYSVPQSSNVVIKVFDVLGNEIETLINEEKPVGNYELTWNAKNIPSGVYFYQLKAGSFIETKKMILLK